MIRELAHRPLVLTIGGHDPCAGAGIQQDLYAIQKMGAWGHSAITALTVQNDISFTTLQWTRAWALQQIEILRERFQYRALKFGMVPDSEFINEVLELFSENEKPVIVWDPVLSASAGFDFHDESHVKKFKEVIAVVDLFTPNLPEAKVFFGEEIYEELIEASEKTAILLKGGHRLTGLPEDELWDAKLFGGMCQRFSSPRVPYDKRGTGCALASGMAAGAALGLNWRNAHQKAKKHLLDYMNSEKEKLGVWYA